MMMLTHHQTPSTAVNGCETSSNVNVGTTNTTTTASMMGDTGGEPQPAGGGDRVEVISRGRMRRMATSMLCQRYHHLQLQAICVAAAKSAEARSKCLISLYIKKSRLHCPTIPPPVTSKQVHHDDSRARIGQTQVAERDCCLSLCGIAVQCLCVVV